MAFAVKVDETPEELAEIFVSQRLKKVVDPAVVAFHLISHPVTIDDFSGIALNDATAQALIEASPDDDTNLSYEEIELFRDLQTTKAVETALRGALFHRLEAYKTSGLKGILPYARSRKTGDYYPGLDMNVSSVMQGILQREVPVFFHHLAHFPRHRPDGLDESYSWVQFDADDQLNVELVHRMAYKQDESFVFSERQYYALNSYNCVHGEGGAIPLQNKTLLVFSSRTSTDAVTGFGGMAKRAIGVRMMGKMVADILQKYQELEAKRVEL